MARHGAIYVRVSTDIQESNGTSLDTQQEACLKLAHESDITVDPAHIYRETYSGAVYRERPELSRLREAARHGAFEVLIIYAFDRLSRDQMHLAVILDDLEYQAIVIECVTEVFDATPSGQFLRSVMGFNAQMERLKMMERTQRGKMERMKRGKLLPGCKSMYGYRWADEQRTRYAIKPTEAAVVRKIFELAASGVTMRKIAKHLMDAGIPSPMGKVYWHQPTIRLILTTPAYAGRAMQRRKQRTRKPNGSYIERTRSADEQIPVPEGVIPPIIDEQIFDSIQPQLAQNKIEASRNNKHPEDSLLRAGMALCGVCGKSMLVTRRNTEGQPRYVCADANGGVVGYRCKGARVAVHILDDAVWEYVSEIIQDSTLIAQSIEALQARLKDPSLGEIRPIKESIKKADTAIDNLVEMLKANRLQGRAKAVILSELEELEHQREQLVAEMGKVRQGQSEWQKQQDEIDRFVAWCHQMQSRLHAPTYEEKRAACRVLGIRAYVWRRDDADHDHFEIRVGVPNIVSTISGGTRGAPAGSSGPG